MSLSDVERLRLEEAIATTGYSIPMNGSRLLDVDGTCDIIRRLLEGIRTARAREVRAAAAEERMRYERDCLQKDYETWKARAKRLEGELVEVTKSVSEACAVECIGEQQACLRHASATKGKAAHNVHMVAAQTAAECARRCRSRGAALSESAERDDA